MKKKKYITNKKERVILSDVLPYELPATFSNRYFYDFLLENKIRLSNDKILWKKKDDALKVIIKLLFGLNANQILSESDNEIQFKNHTLRTIPFGYKIFHKEKEFRELTVIHPLNQLAVVEFYDKYKELILYYCNISSFSIRRPHKLAKFTYHKDKTHFQTLAHDHEHKTVEEFDKEYENLKTFFVYKEISNIYKFFESYKYHRCEKKYDYLFTFDISKCFDSIYSHSITWALLSKDAVKDNIGKSSKTFGGAFDKFMQNLNYGETNGIVIGPEFSRVFAELILQQIDRNVKRILRKQNPPLVNRRDYEIFRYVDDIFVFYNEETTREEIIKIYRLQLMKFKLSINEAKSNLLEKPLITGITRAKLKITDLIDGAFSFKENEVMKENEEAVKKYSFYLSANRLITRFKNVLIESQVGYREIQSYSLAIIDRKVYKLIKTYNEIEEQRKYENKICKTLLEVLDFTFFLYSVFPRVSTTIKLCMIISKATKFAKVKDNFNLDNRHQIFKKVYDEIFLVLKKYESSEQTQVETLYLLIALRELGREYRLTEEVICKHYGIDLEKEECINHLNYFSITVLLFYIQNTTRYSKMKEILQNHILRKFKTIDQTRRHKTTELIFILFDLLACPYLDQEFKNNLLAFYGISTSSRDLISEIVNFRKYWFTKWTDFDFGKELEAKKSQEVY
ncbi:MAG: antiviral reverse transcriptase Drt3b [Cyclobacteriaceae bacterium]